MSEVLAKGIKAKAASFQLIGYTTEQKNKALECISVQLIEDKEFIIEENAKDLIEGKQKGLKIGEIYYDELPKELIMIVVEDKDQEVVTRTIIDNAKINKEGHYGDGKVFITDVEEAITISTGAKEL